MVGKEKKQYNDYRGQTNNDGIAYSISNILNSIKYYNFITRTDFAEDKSTIR